MLIRKILNAVSAKYNAMNDIELEDNFIRKALKEVRAEYNAMSDSELAKCLLDMDIDESDLREMSRKQMIDCLMSYEEMAAFD
jgi:hypothetical protein